MHLVLASEDHNDSPKTKGGDNSTWVYWTIVSVSIVLGSLIAATLYELICRFKEKLKSQTVTDGGPPATPTHNFSYVVGVRGDRCSPSMDTQISVIKVELLDRFNRYITSVAVPCFLLKLKVDDGPPPNKGSKPTHPVYIKTMTVLQEQWAPTEQAELITFQLIMRRPLTDVASARILHDCYLNDAYIVLKYIVFHDPLANVDFMIRLKDQLIRGVHPCPPSSTQVFPVEKLTLPAEELKSFLELTNTKSSSWFSSCLGGGGDNKTTYY
jgi:hypothetical protein